jgi:hypothetical protein
MNPFFNAERRVEPSGYPLIMNHKAPLMKSAATQHQTLGWAFAVVVLPLCVASTVWAQSDAAAGAVAAKPVVAKPAAPATATPSVAPTTSVAKASAPPVTATQSVTPTTSAVKASATKAPAAPPSSAATTAPSSTATTATSTAPSSAATSAPSTAATTAPTNSFFQFEGAPIELQLNTALWLPRLRGNVTYGAAGAPNLDLSTALSLDALEPSFYGDINATWKNWTLRVTGTSFKSTGSIGATGAGSFGSTAFVAGQNLNSSFSYWTAGVEAESWLWRPFSKQEFPWLDAVANESLPVDLRIFGQVGGRAFGIDQSLTNAATGSSSSFSETFGTAYAGGGFNIYFDTREALGFIKRFDVDVGIEAGPVWPGDGGLFMQINATGTAWLNNNVGVYFGYENLRQNVNTNDYELNSYIGGLIMGLSVKF